MKKYFSLYKITLLLFGLFLIIGCVHDDEYDEPSLENYQCADLTATMTLADVKALYDGNTTYEFPAGTTDVIEGYVSSSDETGNIYKTLFIQDSPENPTQGFVIVVDMVSSYTKYPQGSKVYIKLDGLAVGEYRGLVQLGVKNETVTEANGVARIPENMVSQRIFRSCNERAEIVPKVMTLDELNGSTDQYLGCLIQINNAEFHERVLCTTYAPNATSIDKIITDPTSSLTTKVVRNSGYSTFANQLLPSGNGKFVGIYSRFNSTRQLYINRVSDLDMNNYPRLDGIDSNPCELDDDYYIGKSKTIAEIKQLYTSGLTQITDDHLLTAQVTANDATGNLYKYIYVEDATGGIKININKTNLHNDSRFRVGKQIKIKLKNLYVGANGGEIQLGEPYNGNIGQIAEVNMYKHFFDSNMPITNVVPTERTISQLTTADVGRWIKIKDLQFIDEDLGKTLAVGTSATNRTLEDCNGNTIILRTSSFAVFQEGDEQMNIPKITSLNREVDGGKGDVYAILSIYNGTYQLWITNLLGVDLDNPRCDGSIYVPLTTIFEDNFSNGLTNWTTVSVTGAQQWTTSTQGTNNNPYAVMSGFSGGSNANEDWLVSNAISLFGYSQVKLNLDSDRNYSGNALEAFITTNFNGDVNTANWQPLNVPFDTASGWEFVNSGDVDISSYAGQTIYIAFKYTSTSSASATWELDNIKLKGN